MARLDTTELLRSADVPAFVEVARSLLQVSEKIKSLGVNHMRLDAQISQPELMYVSHARFASVDTAKLVASAP